MRRFFAGLILLCSIVLLSVSVYSLSELFQQERKDDGRRVNRTGRIFPPESLRLSQLTEGFLRCMGKTRTVSAGLPYRIP